MSKTYPHLFGTSLSITDHQIKAITAVFVSSVISLLTFLTQNPSVPDVNLVIFIIQLLASALLLFTKNGTVTNSEYRFILYIIAQFLFTAIQNFSATGEIVLTRAVVLAALLQGISNIYGIIEGEWSGNVPGLAAPTGPAPSHE